MTFDPAWEQFHATQPQMAGRFPNFEKLLATFVTDAGKLLELGAGVGMNIPYFAYREADYYGIEGSESAVKQIVGNYPNLKDRLSVGDFTEWLPVVDGGYDVVCERASIPHNDLASIRRCLDLVYDALKPGGIFISSDWFSTNHSEVVRGAEMEHGTRAEYPNGQFFGAGKIHFSDEYELAHLFRKFDGIHMEERVMRRPAPNRLVSEVVRFRWISREFDDMEYRSAVWDIVVRKPL